MSEEYEKLLVSIVSMTEALNLCWKGSGLPSSELADRLGIGYSHFMRMMNPNDHMNFPVDLIPRLMTECKSILPLEWLAWQMGYRLHDKSLTQVLVAIREALAKDGASPRFSIRASGVVVSV